MPVKAGENHHFYLLTDKQAQLLPPGGLTILEAVRRVAWAHSENIQAEMPTFPAMSAWLNASFALKGDINVLEDAYKVNNTTPTTYPDTFDGLALCCRHCDQ